MPSFEAGVFEKILPSTDLRVSLTPHGPKYEFEVGAGAKISAIALRFEGADRILLGNGELLIETPAGVLRDAAPACWYGDGGEQLVCRYAMGADGSVGFEAPLRDPSRPVVIDPLIYATYLGGSSLTDIHAMAAGAGGAAFVAGSTTAADFPTTPGAYNRSPEHLGFLSPDAFLSKLRPDGASLEFSTFLGGDGWDVIDGLQVDAQGGIFLAGKTDSTNFPTTAGANKTGPPERYTDDGFFARLSPTGSSLIASTLIGGSDNDEVADLAIATDGSVFVGGTTSSSDFPVTAGAVKANRSVYQTGFVARLNADGSRLLYATFLGGSGGEFVLAVAADAEGNVVVVGRTGSEDFPVTPGALMPRFGGRLENGYIAKIDPDAGRFVFSTYYANSTTDLVADVAVDSQGAIYVVGKGDDVEPTQGAYGSGKFLEGPFVSKITADGHSVVWSSRIGGFGETRGESIAVGQDGRVAVVGTTVAPDFPTTEGAAGRTLAKQDAYVSVFSADGKNLLYSSYIGGNDSEWGAGIGFSPEGDLLVGGMTHSTVGLATAGVLDVTYGGVEDSFVARIRPDYVTPPTTAGPLNAGGLVGAVVILAAIVGAVGLVGVMIVRRRKRATAATTDPSGARPGPAAMPPTGALPYPAAPPQTSVASPPPSIDAPCPQCGQPVRVGAPECANCRLALVWD